MTRMHGGDRGGSLLWLYFFLVLEAGAVSQP